MKKQIIIIEEKEKEIEKLQRELNKEKINFLKYYNVDTKLWEGGIKENDTYMESQGEYQEISLYDDIIDAFEVATKGIKDDDIETTIIKYIQDLSVIRQCPLKAYSSKYEYNPVALI